MSDPATHEVHGDEGMPAEFIDRPDLLPGDGDVPVPERSRSADGGQTDGQGDAESDDESDAD
jgi:hypothetical protein